MHSDSASGFVSSMMEQAHCRSGFTRRFSYQEPHFTPFQGKIRTYEIKFGKLDCALGGYPMLLCLNCGFENPNDQVFCMGCKADLTSKKAILDLVDKWPNETPGKSADSKAPAAHEPPAQRSEPSPRDHGAFTIPADMDLGAGIRFAPPPPITPSQPLLDRE